MQRHSLNAFCAAVRASWAPICTEIVEDCTQRLADLTNSGPTEGWLAALHAERPASRELYRDPVHQFMLLAHSEHAGLYRPPHDHGRAWVVYGVQAGELEIGTYAAVTGPAGHPVLVRRDLTRLRAGEARAYLPGDIHDTRCVSDTAILFRFAERDLRREDQDEHRVTRYVERNGSWTVPRP